LAVSAPVDCEPLTALVPVQEPEAEQLVAFLADHVNVEAAPELTVLGLALNVITGADAATVTVADCSAEPPGPVQASVYSALVERGPVDQPLPFVDTAPCQPPDAVHAVALAVCQFKLDEPPLAMVDGVAVRVTVGADAITTTFVDPDAEPDPLEPVQVSV
jgi:hypothetical protein